MRYCLNDTWRDSVGHSVLLTRHRERRWPSGKDNFFSFILSTFGVKLFMVNIWCGTAPDSAHWLPCRGFLPSGWWRWTSGCSLGLSPELPTRRCLSSKQNCQAVDNRCKRENNKNKTFYKVPRDCLCCYFLFCHCLICCVLRYCHIHCRCCCGSLL